MKVITGVYQKLKAECGKIFPKGYFDFYFIYTPEAERFREIDRFLYESRHTLRFENEYSGDIVVDLSDWNHKHINSYFEAFMYFLMDNADKYNCLFIVNERCSEEILGKLAEIFGEIEESQVSAVKRHTKAKIGFVDDERKDECNVRG